MTSQPRRPAGGYAHAELTGRIIGVFYDVYNGLGFGFLESVYQQAMCAALRDASLAVESQPLVRVRFRGRVLGDFRPDLVIERSVIVELKAARQLDAAHEAQLLNYLKATDIEVGLLLNFGPRPAVRRFAFTAAPYASCEHRGSICDICGSPSTS